MIFWELFVSYLKIGFFGFGGGYAMLSLIQNEVVVQHAWMTNAEFADIVAVSQITPGPIAINSATYVGYTVGMQSGSVWYGILGLGHCDFRGLPAVDDADDSGRPLHRPTQWAIRW